MSDFYSPVHTVSVLPRSPRLLCVSEETRAAPTYRYEGRANPNPPHVIFQHTLSGCGLFKDRSGERPVPAGVGFLSESDDPDVGYFYPREAAEPWRFIFMDFTGEAAYAMARDLIGTFGHLYRLPRGSTILGRLVGFHVHDQKGCFIPASEGARLVTDLLHVLLRGKEVDDETDPKQVLVRSARRAIQSTVHQRVTVGDVAGRLRVSREHLTRAFKKEMGLAPYQYILGCKILAACGLLKSESLEIKEVAVAVGYNSTSHFSRAFQRVMHTTPGQFREHGVVPASVVARNGEVQLV